MLETLNRSLLGLVVAPTDLSVGAFLFAFALAKWAIFVIPATLTLLWIFGDTQDRRSAFGAGLAACIALAFAGAISSFYFHPRPFMDGVARNYLHHAVDSSFPSDHAMLWMSVATGIFLVSRRIGALALLIVGAIIRSRRRGTADADAQLADTPLVVSALTKTYPNGFRAVDGVSFVVEHGQVLGLLGPNGAGKTTTLRMVLGLIRPEGGEVRVKLRANELWIYDGRQVVARHPRLTRRYTYHDILDHYLEILLVKPGAFAGASALAQARAEGGFTRTHEAFWAAAKRKAGDREGTRMLIEVLLLHRQLPADALIAGMTTVLRVGSVSTDLVAIEARKAMENTEADAFDELDDIDEPGPVAEDDDDPNGPGQDETDGEGAKVISLHTRRLPPDPRTALPDMAKYDRLLTPMKDTGTTKQKGTSA